MLLIYSLVSYLAFLSTRINGITIDNELQLIKNDCYERMAIGHRLAAKNVYKTSSVKTVAECQQFCTREQELCKSFSFGIGVKGNTTCELSNDPIKETADLKPIGTRTETDFDLYIKKLGCTLVVDPNSKKKPHIPPKPVHEPDYNSSPPKPLENNYGNKPSSSPGINYRPNPPSVSNNGGGGGGGYGSQSNHQPPPASYQNSVEHVQTLVSISSGPQKPILHPVHEILIGEETYHYGRPPFRPSNLNHPYNTNNNEADSHHRPNYNSYYGGERPETDRYDSGAGYFSQRPIPERYGSYISRPEDYGRPTRPDDYYRPNHYFERPEEGGYDGGSRPPSFRPDPPSDYGSRPSFARPRPPLGYDSRPVLPLIGYENGPSSGGYDLRPNPSNNYENRPASSSNDYQNRPNPSSSYDSRPNGYENRPNPSSGYDSRPNPSNNYDSRPNPSNNYENRPNPPSDYNSKPEKPIEYGTKPPSIDYLFNNNNDNNQNGGYGSSKPSNRPEKPNGSSSNGSYSNQKKPTIITQSVGSHGEKITSIITELEQKKE